ncbi:MAG TPA: NADH-quinone oxidoreductase subunit NuoF [Solirubrobacteraceae bacterium]|nr:NADH-quinone oxidoreductase subunit NuoF [Solirubrobacteraceae bacterium]
MSITEGGRIPVHRFSHGSRVPGWDDAVDLTKPPAVVPDPGTTPVPKELRRTIVEAMQRYPDRRSAAIPALHAAQAEYGWCSPEAITQVAAVMQLTPAYLTSVATFYDMLVTHPKPPNDVFVCTNISCSLRGADELYEAMLLAAAEDPNVDVRSFECLGACDIAPMASVNGEYIGPLSPDDAATIVEQVSSGQPVLPDKQLSRRPCVDTGTGPHLLFKDIDEPGLNTLEVYRRRGGYEALKQALSTTREETLNQLLAANIRGRGGAGFPMGRKISFLPKGDMVKYLVCNADESEPGTFKDRELMQKAPHMLIEGIAIACWAGEIDTAFIYIRGEYDFQADILEAAIDEARAAGYIGENVLGSELSFSLVLHRGAGAYICGEETGLLDSLEGKRGNPRLKPPFPAIEGLYDGPTLINNVETLSTAPTIILMGGEKYAELGAENSTGTKLVSVSGDVQRPGNYEVELGTSSREIIFNLAGGTFPGREVKLWFPGGSSSPVLTKDDLDLPYDFDSMAKAGSMLGSGAVIVVDDSHTVLQVAQKLAKFYAHESCGKCVPCREGTNWTVKMLQRIESGEATPMDLDLMASVQTHIIGNCLCVLGDAMAMPIGSIIEKFRPELESEIEEARLRAGTGLAEDAGPFGNADEFAGPLPVH